MINQCDEQYKHFQNDSLNYQLNIEEFDVLLDMIKVAGYQLIATKLQQDQLVLAEIQGRQDLPAGYKDIQKPGCFHLEKRNDTALFGYSLCAQSPKLYLDPPRQKIFSASKNDEAISITPSPLPKEKLAFIGLKSCDLKALEMLDRIYIHDKYINASYAARRRNALIVAVDCHYASESCFCTSTQSGPQVENGFDLRLTEILDKKEHYFLLSIGSAKGKQLLGENPVFTPLKNDLKSLRKKQLELVTVQITRKMNVVAAAEFAKIKTDEKHWQQLAKDCTNCANCTMSCPTCFCSNVEDMTDLSGEHTQRWESWDSCFNIDHSYIHGGAIRASSYSRYRNWFTHKFYTWQDQFDTIGCVGCGRCVTWCPVGIDVTKGF